MGNQLTSHIKASGRTEFPSLHNWEDWWKGTLYSAEMQPTDVEMLGSCEMPRQKSCACSVQFPPSYLKLL